MPHEARTTIESGRRASPKRGEPSATVVQFEAIQAVDIEAYKAELLSQEELFLKIAGDMPKEMIFQRELLVSRL